MHLNFGKNLFPEQSLMTIDDRQRNKASAEHFYQVLIFERFRSGCDNNRRTRFFRKVGIQGDRALVIA